MLRKTLLALTLAAVAAPVAADPPGWAPAHGKRAKERHAMYNSHGRYYEPRRIRSDERVWRGDDGRYHCRRSNGTTGLIVGAAAGALLGRAVDSRGDRATGTILGAAGGALLGREIDRGDLRCR